MFRVLEYLAKIIPSIYYLIKLCIFIASLFGRVDSIILRILITYGIPTLIGLLILLYFTLFRDLLTRQKSREQQEDENRNYTVKTQSMRMLRKYVPLLFIGIISGLVFYFYKPYLISLSIKFGILYSFFCFGEVMRIIHIGIKEQKKLNSQLNPKELSQKKEENLNW